MSRFLAVTGLIVALWCAGGSLAQEKKGPVYATLKTSMGDIVIQLFEDKAPKTVANFIELATGVKEWTDPKTKEKVKRPLYNRTIFHRVIPGFMIQGGDPNTKDSLKKDTYGQGGPGHTVKAEFSDIPHKRGIVSMARAADPDTAGSQFFIVVEDSRFLDRKYSVFGEVTKGIGVADKIVNSARDERDNPKERVEMTVTIAE